MVVRFCSERSPKEPHARRTPGSRRPWGWFYLIPPKKCTAGCVARCPEINAGAAPPPLFGLRDFPVELAGLHCVFVARLRRRNFFIFAFFYIILGRRLRFSAEKRVASALWSRNPGVAAPDPVGAPLRPRPRWGCAPNPLVSPGMIRAPCPAAHSWCAGPGTKDICFYRPVFSGCTKKGRTRPTETALGPQVFIVT